MPCRKTISLDDFYNKRLERQEQEAILLTNAYYKHIHKISLEELFYEKGNDIMSEIQRIILDIFKEVSKLCEDNNISYYAIGGTCLGAVRHKGFIPWDDDLDIAIPIEEYRRFIDIAKEKLPKHLELYIPCDSNHNGLLFIKIIDSRTTCIESYHLKHLDTFMGAWIDIMPISGVPIGEKEQKKFVSKTNWIKRINYKLRRDFNESKKISGSILWILVYPFRSILNPVYCWNYWLDFLAKYPFYKSKYTGYVWSKRLYNLIFPQEWFNDFVYLDFEDTKIRCPKEYDKFLSQMFGNYMECPPENQRNSGHDFSKGIIDLEHSYKDYQSGKLKIEKKVL